MKWQSAEKVEEGWAMIFTSGPPGHSVCYRPSRIIFSTKDPTDEEHPDLWCNIKTGKWFLPFNKKDE